MKKIFCLLIVFSLLFVLCSCSSGVKLYSGDDVETIKYKNNLYFNYHYDQSWSMKSKDYVTQVGWTFYFPFYCAYYADEKENPTFIYCSRTRQCFFREDIDYMDVELVLKNDENKNFTFSDIISESIERTAIDKTRPDGSKRFIAYMKCCLSMEILFEIIKNDNIYYLEINTREVRFPAYVLNEEYLDFFGVDF